MNSRGGAMSSNLPNYAEKSTNPTVAPNSYVQGGSSFAFRKRWCQIDWRLLALVDVDRIAKEMDFQSLQQNIMNITFCNIDTEEFQHVDRNFIKIFKLSQLVIEYLLHSQQYLSNQASSLEQKVICVQQELDKATNDLKSREGELKAVKKENRKRRKIIEAYQDMINAGATGLHACPVCKREFVSGEYLQSHIQRRHPGYMSNGVEQPKVTQEDLETKLMEQMTKRLLSSETQLRKEMKQKEKETLQLQVEDFENWKREEKTRMTIEMEEFKRPVITELEEIRQEKRHLEKILQEKEEELLSAQVRRQSHLGHLEGAKELMINEANKLNESNAEIQHLKGALGTQMQEMQTALKEQDKSWQKKMKRLSTSCEDKLTDSIAKLETLERTVHDGSQTDRRDDKVSKKLKSLKQKMKQQEELLLSQQDQLTSLQSREPSPIPLDDPDGSSDSDSDSEGDCTDFHDGKRFTPMNHRPLVKTKYPHTPEDTEKIRRQTHAIFSDMLVQKGLQRESNGLKNKDFEEKMAMLQQERQQKIQTHYHFAEHRQKLVKAVEEIITSDYKSVPSHKLQIPSPRQKYRSTLGASTNSMGKPPKHTQKVTLSPTESTNIKLELDSKVSVDSDESDTSITSSSEEISTKDKEQNIPTVIITAGVNNPTPRARLEMAQEQSTITKVNDSWDSDDSIEELDPPHNGRTSSTPIKVFNATASKEAVDQHLDNISADSFDLSSSELLAKSQPTKVAPPATAGFKPQSGTVTSQSAFTSVSMEDFDSDSSDLDISDLT